MITEEQYLEAQKIVDNYKNEQLIKQAIISSVVIRDDCPDDYWYYTLKGTQFNIKPCHYSDLRVEGFSNTEPNECWKVADGEFAGNVILKKHCVTIRRVCNG